MVTAQYAVLVKEFRLTLPEIYALTPRQIHEIYFHARDKDGAVELPKAPLVAVDARTQLAQLVSFASAIGAPADQIEKLKRRLEAIDNGDTRGTT